MRAALVTAARLVVAAGIIGIATLVHTPADAPDCAAHTSCNVAQQ